MTNLFGVDTTPLLTTFVDPTHDNCKINLILKGKLSYVKNIIDEVFTDLEISSSEIQAIDSVAPGRNFLSLGISTAGIISNNEIFYLINSWTSLCISSTKTLRLSILDWSSLL